MKKKKLIGIILVATLVAIVFAGCTGEGDTEDEEDEYNDLDDVIDDDYYDVDIYISDGTNHTINVTLEIDDQMVLYFTEYPLNHGGTLHETISLSEGNHEFFASENNTKLEKTENINITARTYLEIYIGYTKLYGYGIGFVTFDEPPNYI